MKDEDRKPPGGSADAARAARLKQALRQNLKRRKEQKRNRARDPAAGPTHDSAGFAADKPKR